MSEELGYDEDLIGLSPGEDDDDDDIDLLDDIEDEAEADKQASGGNTQPLQNPSQQTPFGNPTNNSNPWNNNTGTSWRPAFTPSQPNQTVFPGSFGLGNNNGQPSQQNTFGGWGNNNNAYYRPQTPTWTPSWVTPGNNNGKQNLPRAKKIIMCDLLDNVIEPLSSQGKVGSQPQGIYDMRIKFEVLDRFRAINPEYLFILTNQNFTKGTPAGKVYKAMIDYLVYSIAEYMRIPYENVKCITKTGYNIQDPNVKPNTGLITIALKTIPNVKSRFKKEDILICGSASGLAGQGNRDIEMARKFGVDYIDIQQLLTYYI